ALVAPPQTPAPAQSVEAITPTAPLVPVAVTPPIPAPSVPSVQPAPDTPPSMVAAKLMAGASAVAIQAAEPRSNAPLRILVTRRTHLRPVVRGAHSWRSPGLSRRTGVTPHLGKAGGAREQGLQKSKGNEGAGTLKRGAGKKLGRGGGKGGPPARQYLCAAEFVPP